MASAAKSTSLKHLILLSSFAAMYDFDGFPDVGKTYKDDTYVKLSGTTC
jgi:hypothetical protein